MQMLSSTKSGTAQSVQLLDYGLDNRSSIPDKDKRFFLLRSVGSRGQWVRGLYPRG
jgi:hypothetical protein